MCAFVFELAISFNCHVGFFIYSFCFTGSYFQNELAEVLKQHLNTLITR